MIWRPQPGQHVEIRYGKAYCHVMPFQGHTGTIQATARGPGPINVLIRLADGMFTVAPRGNLFDV